MVRKDDGLPEWMAEADDDTRGYIAYAEPEIAVEIARYCEAYSYQLRRDAEGKAIDPSDDEKAYLYLLVQAVFLKNARSILEWKEYANSYPTVPLIEGYGAWKKSEAIKIRSHYLRQALVSLLNLIGAPKAMIKDIDSILALHSPRQAKARAETQKIMSEMPGASLREIARKAGRNPGQISKDITAGRLVKARKRDYSRRTSTRDDT